MKNKIPINRVNKFYSEEDYLFDIEIGREYLEGDIGMTVVLYRVNQQFTETDSIYGETVKDGVVYYPPVELKGIVDFKAPENKSYNSNGSFRYLEDGNLVLTIYQKYLEERGIEVTYGDYIGYPVTETQMRYFVVANDGIKNYNNSHTIMGYKPTYRTITCVPTDKSEFSGI